MTTTDLPGIELFRRGKVRDTFDLGETLLMVASDRLSAFDVVLPTPIPLKGIVLTQLSRFWFEQTGGIIPNHLISADITTFPEALRPFASTLAGRSMIVRKAERIDIECVVRGHVAGSAWTEYRAEGTIAGIPVPRGLQQASQLPEPIFTPAAKNDAGHDENISIARMRDLVGSDLTARLEAASISLYDYAAGVAARRGIIVADTKFEFGFVDGALTLIDEMVTPDSSRIWDAELYRPGQDQPSFDKQYVRDWLNDSGWSKEPPGPELPAEVVAGTSARYHEAYKRLTGSPLWYESGAEE